MHAPTLMTICAYIYIYICTHSDDRSYKVKLIISLSQIKRNILS